MPPLAARITASLNPDLSEACALDSRPDVPRARLHGDVWLRVGWFAEPDTPVDERPQAQVQFFVDERHIITVDGPVTPVEQVDRETSEPTGIAHLWTVTAPQSVTLDDVDHEVRVVLTVDGESVELVGLVGPEREPVPEPNPVADQLAAAGASADVIELLGLRHGGQLLDGDGCRAVLATARRLNLDVLEPGVLLWLRDVVVTVRAELRRIDNAADDIRGPADG